MIDWKRREIFSNLMIPPDIPAVVRVDGWRFRRLAEEVGLERPFDRRMPESMVSAAKELMSLNLPVVMVYAFSDEASLLLAPPVPWNGRVEKLVSVLSSLFSAVVSLEIKHAASFDGRVILIREEGELVDYLSWRQDEAWRNALNSYALAALEREGMTRGEAARELRGKKSDYLHELVFEKLGINLAKVPTWQRRGVVVRKSVVIRKGEHGSAKRKEIVVDWEIPLFSSPEGRRYLREIFETSSVFSGKGITPDG